MTTRCLSAALPSWCSKRLAQTLSADPPRPHFCPFSSPPHVHQWLKPHVDTPSPHQVLAWAYICCLCSNHSLLGVPDPWAHGETLACSASENPTSLPFSPQLTATEPLCSQGLATAMRPRTWPCTICHLHWTRPTLTQDPNTS
jgi:hypothetical protein